MKAKRQAFDIRVDACDFFDLVKLDHDNNIITCTVRETATGQSVMYIIRTYKLRSRLSTEKCGSRACLYMWGRPG